MSEVVIENVEEVAVKKFKKSSVLLAFALFILIAALAVMIDIGGLIIFDFLFFFGLAMYGKISGKLETGAHKPYEETMAGFSGYTLTGHRDLFQK